MESLHNQVFQVTAIVGWVAAAALIIHYFAYRTKRRALELETAATALRAYYESLDRIVDDPAMPESALYLLDRFNSALSSKEHCRDVTSEMLKMAASGKVQALSRPVWRSEVDTLAKTRPDLYDTFHKATTNGIIAMFYRWPGNGWKMPVITQILSDKDSETAVAERISHIDEKPRNRHRLIAA